MDKSKMLNLKKGIVKKIQEDKKMFIIVCIGILGMILLLFSELFDSSNNDTSNKDTAKKASTSSEYNYSEEIENKLTKIISSIEGAGKTKVMVTLDNSAESVYAKNEKEDENSKKSSDNSQSEESTENQNDSEYIIIDSGDKESGLVIKVIQPKIRGVAIVCEGADSAVVRENIMDTVTAVLDIDSTNVCITKMTNDN